MAESTSKATTRKSSATAAPTPNKSAGSTQAAGAAGKTARPRAAAAKSGTGRTAPAAERKSTAARKPAAPRTTAKASAAVSEEQRLGMIAEAAYYRAERNQFQGDPVQDWIEAEKEIAAHLGAGKTRAKGAKKDH